MSLLSIRSFKSALAAVRAAEVLHVASIPAVAIPAFKLVVRGSSATEAEPVLNAAGFASPTTQTHTLYDDARYSGEPRVMRSVTVGTVDPAHSILLADLLEQAAVLAEHGCMYIDGETASGWFAGIAAAVRESMIDSGRDDVRTEDTECLFRCSDCSISAGGTASSPMPQARTGYARFRLPGWEIGPLAYTKYHLPHCANRSYVVI